MRGTNPHNIGFIPHMSCVSWGSHILSVYILYVKLYIFVPNDKMFLQITFAEHITKR